MITLSKTQGPNCSVGIRNVHIILQAVLLSQEAQQPSGEEGEHARFCRSPVVSSFSSSLSSASQIGFHVFQAGLVLHK